MSMDYQHPMIKILQAIDLDDRRRLAVALAEFQEQNENCAALPDLSNIVLIDELIHYCGPANVCQRMHALGFLDPDGF